MRVLSDAMAAHLDLMRALGNSPLDVDRAYAKAAGWAGAREMRPPYLSEMVRYLVAHRTERPKDVPIHPEPAVSPLLRLVAGNLYGLPRERGPMPAWPLNHIRAPFEPNDGPVIRFYVALCLGLSRRFKLEPARWPTAAAWVRVVLMVASVMLAALLFGSLGAFVVATPLILWLPLAHAHALERVDWARAIVQGNQALLLAYLTQAKEVTPSRNQLVGTANG